MYNKSIEEITKSLGSNLTEGLSNKQVEMLLKSEGYNVIEEDKQQSIVIRFLLQFKDVLILILLIAAIVSIIIDPTEWIDSLIIFIVVIINAVLGLVQEEKASKALKLLKKISSPNVIVIREGVRQKIPTSNVVVGDIIELGSGDVVCADARLIHSNNLKIDESSLTGESHPVLKNSSILHKQELGVGDQINMVFSSTSVIAGSGIGIVTATGMNTEVGKIAKLIQNSSNKNTPLQDQLNNIGKILGVICMLICLGVFVLELLGGLTPIDAFKTSITLAVAAIPEGLATTVTVVLAIGVQKMVKENVIIKQLPAVETLGCTSVICSDKTGTLTQNKMTVVKGYLCNDNQIRIINDNLPIEFKKMIAYFELCSNVQSIVIDGVVNNQGDPTEVALVEASIRYGFKTNKNIQRVKEIPFDSTRKMMSVVIKINNHYFVISKGAPDVLITKCKDCNYHQVILANERMAQEALRVLGIAIKELDSLPSSLSNDKLEKDMIFVGMLGMIDPPKEGVKDSIVAARDAGIRTIMITGDHITTACAIAKELSIMNANSGAMTGLELNQISDDELKKSIHNYSVFARVSPEHKLRIVKAFQENGEIVAMTGDGVNDSPALKKADIGCAMGKKGSDVAKNVSSLILTDDNYSTIVKAVKQGRGVYNNIQKVIRFLLSSNIGEVLTIVLASIISIISNKNFGVPLLPIHLLFVNLITDALPAFALGLEPIDDEIMLKKPRKKDQGFFKNKMGLNILIEGCIIGVITIISFFVGLTISYPVASTMAFVTLSISQLFHAFNVKSGHSILNKQVFNNKYLWLALVLGVVFEVAIINVPLFSKLFSLSKLSLMEIVVSVGLAFMIVVIVEFIKEFKRFIKKAISKKWPLLMLNLNLFE